MSSSNLKIAAARTRALERLRKIHGTREMIAIRSGLTYETVRRAFFSPLTISYMTALALDDLAQNNDLVSTMTVESKGWVLYNTPLGAATLATAREKKVPIARFIRQAGVSMTEFAGASYRSRGFSDARCAAIMEKLKAVGVTLPDGEKKS